MDTEHRVIAELLALKDAPDDALLDQVDAIGERAARHMLCDEAAWLQHTDQATATDCAGLIDRIDVLRRRIETRPISTPHKLVRPAIAIVPAWPDLDALSDQDATNVLAATAAQDTEIV